MRLDRRFRALAVAATVLLGFGLVSVLIGAPGGGLAAQGDAVGQRQAQMKAMARALAPLLDMAQGRLPYDAAKASAAAAELAALDGGDPMALYPAGSDRESLGRGLALPAIWSDSAAFRAAARTYADAVAQLQQQAGSGRDALRGAVGGVSAACGACHQRFRASN